MSPTPVLVEASGTSNSDGASHPPSIDISAPLKTVSRYNQHSVTTSIPPSQPLSPRWVRSALSRLSPTRYLVPNSVTRPWDAGSLNTYNPLLDNIILMPDGPTRRLRRVGARRKIAQQTTDKGKVSVSIDFGKSSAPTLA